jgi:hypothetical protein
MRLVDQVGQTSLPMQSKKQAQANTHLSTADLLTPPPSHRLIPFTQNL